MLNCQIDFPDSQVSPAVKDKIMDEIEALNDRYGNITTCHVSVRIPHKHKEHPFFHIHVRLEVPGKTFIVGKEPEKNSEHRDVYLALRDSFDVLERRLRKHFEKVKNHLHHKKAM
ncbi:MAG: ribosome-associated translation inhibitor RaiA [Bdellovibrionales bacterium]|nr:ribosome-associated translation inhibitor RaiA [Bdellovibrionales bacterium]